MRYFSTQKRSEPVTFRDAVLTGQPPDGGLYFPSEVPRWSREFVSGLRTRSNADIAFEIIRPYIGGEIPDAQLNDICAETVDFPFPLIRISETIFSLELFHGPTMAFKDVGARFMSRCLRHFAGDRSRKALVVVATSGDTGGAVAAGFHRAEGVEVVILYPKGRVSHIQELQLTSVGDNVTTLEVRGSFDDCQRLAKQVLGDPELRKRSDLTSANSINIGRWLPQQFYYAFGLREWPFEEPPVFSVPSGNFGNISSGLLAYRSGLPVRRFIAACNANDTVPRFIHGQEYEPKKSVQTVSSAMDVGDPSNFARVQQLLGVDRASISAVMEASRVSDAETVSTMRSTFEEFGYALDPHGAVAFHALADFLEASSRDRGIFLETAHPAKFEAIKEVSGNYDVTPPQLKDLAARPAAKIEVDSDYGQVLEIIKSRI